MYYVLCRSCCFTGTKLQKITLNIATYGLGISAKGQKFTSSVSHGLAAQFLIVIAKFSRIFFKRGAKLILFCNLRVAIKVMVYKLKIIVHCFTSQIKCCYQYLAICKLVTFILYFICNFSSSLQMSLGFIPALFIYLCIC